jgi:hypothetical protein
MILAAGRFMMKAWMSADLHNGEYFRGLFDMIRARAGSSAVTKTFEKRSTG